MTGQVGFVGLGIMGRPMARNLLRAGYELVVHNRSRSKAEELGEEGASVAENPKEVAESCEIIITMLPDSSQVEEVLAGENGVFEGVREGALLVDMSTISPVATKELAAEARERGASMLDAPVSGGEPGAEAGTLSIMVGGNVEDFERARPLFDVLGNTVVHVGESGTGQVVKACNQIVVALTIEAVSEALVLGSKAGVDPGKVLDVLSGGLAANKVMEIKREKLLSHDFTPGGKVEFHRKDLQIGLEAGREYGVSLPVTSIVDQMFGALLAAGRGGWDHVALLTLIEDWAGYREAHTTNPET